MPNPWPSKSPALIFVPSDTLVLRQSVAEMKMTPVLAQVDDESPNVTAARLHEFMANAGLCLNEYLSKLEEFLKN